MSDSVGVSSQEISDSKSVCGCGSPASDAQQYGRRWEACLLQGNESRPLARTVCDSKVSKYATLGDGLECPADGGEACEIRLVEVRADFI